MEITVEEFAFAVCVKVQIFTVCMRAFILVLIRSPLLHFNLSYSFNSKAANGTNKTTTYFGVKQLTTDKVVDFPVENGVLWIELGLQYANDYAKTGN